jgi:dinuclear metal center YbgI/SA1388 family protein
MRVKDVVSLIEQLAPLHYQESYDNSGLTAGNPNDEVTGIMLCLDVTDAVLEQAHSEGLSMVISHHPLVFKPLKRLTDATRPERLMAKAIRYGLALYACHTSLDSAREGVSWRMAQILGLQNIRTLEQRDGELRKIAVYTPESHAEEVREAMFAAGAGAIGRYDKCSFNGVGVGTFRAGSDCRPFVGEIGVREDAPEVKIETVVPRHLCNSVVNAARRVHPYEEMAYDVYTLNNVAEGIGLGTIGELPEKMAVMDFIKIVKEKFNCEHIEFNEPHCEMVSRVAMCGGSGASLAGAAAACGAEVFITGEMKFSEFFDTEGKITTVRIGHYESEICAVDILFDYLTKKIPTFAVRKCGISTNPIRHL